LGIEANDKTTEYIMILVEKFEKKSWYIHKKCRSMRDAKKIAKDLSKNHEGEVKAEKTNRYGENLESVYYQKGELTESYNW